MNKLICTPNEAAKMLVMTPDTVRRLIHEGEIPAFKEGSHYKIVISQLVDYIESRAKKEAHERRAKHASDK